MLNTTLTALLLCLGLLSGCAAGGGGEAHVPGGMPGAVETDPGSETAQPAKSQYMKAPEDQVAMTCRIVDGAETGELILAGEGAGSVYTLNAEGLTVLRGGVSAAPSDLRDGMLVEVLYDGLILETYPAQFANVWGLSITAEPADDRCGLYLQVLADLWQVDNGLNSDVTELGVDLSAVSDLSPAERSAVAHAFGMAHGIMPVEGTLEEMRDEGYLTKDPAAGDDPALAFYYWEKGCHFSISGDASAFEAQKWRSGLGAYFFSACSGFVKDGAWSYSVGREAIA